MRFPAVALVVGLGLGAAGIVAGAFGWWGNPSRAASDTARSHAPQLARDGFGDNLSEYLRGQRRYGHLKDGGTGEVEQYVLELNDLVDRLERGFGGPK